MKSSENHETPGFEKGESASAASCLVITIALILMLSAGIYALQSYFANRTVNLGSQAADTGKNISYVLTEIRPEWWETSDHIYFGIPARIVFHAPENLSVTPEALAAKIWTEFERIGKVFNPFDPESETGQLNAADKRGPILVSEEMHEVLSISKRLWEVSNGAFDPTMFPIKQMWDTAVKSQEIPSNRNILKTMSVVGFENVAISKNNRQISFNNKSIRLDFGGIAKGYAVDKITELLEAHNIPSALISLAGEIRVFGKNNDAPWRLGIQHPEEMAALWGVVSSDMDIRISTSGNYRQPLIIAGREFYHIYNPQTGRPVSEKISSVSTLSISGNASNALLDGAATAIVVMGAAKGKRFAERIGIETLILSYTRGNKIEETMTDGFKDHYEPM